MAAAPVTEIEIDVQVDDTILEADALRQWVEQEASKTLASTSSALERRGRIVVEVGGALYQYEVHLAAMRDGRGVGDPVTWSCDCSNEQLLEKVRADLPRVIAALEVEPTSAPAVVTRPRPPQDEPDGTREPRRLSPAGTVGVVLVGVGVAALGAGITMAVLPNRRAVSGPVAREQRVEDLRPPGLLVAGAGLGVLAAGTTLVLLRKRLGPSAKAKSAAIVTPAIGRAGQAGVSVSGRF
ncbi:MAG: hypothetical protein K0V04_37325 [Deltaproteobacteria bacterium]|nr:hypothetical protein [Deltaproteobacteria bacterium]